MNNEKRGRNSINFVPGFLSRRHPSWPATAAALIYSIQPRACPSPAGLLLIMIAHHHPGMNPPTRLVTRPGQGLLPHRAIQMVGKDRMPLMCSLPNHDSSRAVHGRFSGLIGIPGSFRCNRTESALRPMTAATPLSVLRPSNLSSRLVQGRQVTPGCAPGTRGMA